MSFSSIVTFDTAGHFTFDATLIEVSGGLIRLKDLGGATYSTANPAITMQHRVSLSGLTSFSTSKSVTGSDQIKHQLIINDTAYWYNAANLSWEEVPEDGGYSYANTAAEISAAIATVFSDLILSGSQWFRLKTFLHSAAGSTRPTLTSATLGYPHAESTPDVIAECLVFAYLKDLLGAAYPEPSSDKPITLYVKNDRTFQHGNTLILPFTKSVEFNASAYAELSVIETETPGEKLDFSITYYDGPSLQTIRFKPAIVPDTATRALNSVANVVEDGF